MCYNVFRLTSLTVYPPLIHIIDVQSFLLNLIYPNAQGNIFQLEHLQMDTLADKNTSNLANISLFLKENTVYLCYIFVDQVEGEAPLNAHFYTAYKSP